MTFSVFSIVNPSGVRSLSGDLLNSMASSSVFANIDYRIVNLASGRAIRVMSTVSKAGARFTDIKYGIAHGRHQYVVTFMGLPSLMRAHAGQIAAAANSIHFVR